MILCNISYLQLDTVQSNADRLGFDDLSLEALQRAVTLNADPVEKLSSRLQLATFFSHIKICRTPKVNMRLIGAFKYSGIVRANVDFYWAEKQPAKAVAILESAAGHAQPCFQIGFRREAARRRQILQTMPPPAVCSIFCWLTILTGDLLAANA